MGFGKGAAGTNGTGFQLLVIIFVELFGVSLGQLIAAICPSVQVRWGPRRLLCQVNTSPHFLGRRFVQSIHHVGSNDICGRHNPLPDDG